jgi:hypothetical protein
MAGMADIRSAVGQLEQLEHVLKSELLGYEDVQTNLNLALHTFLNTWQVMSERVLTKAEMEWEFCRQDIAMQALIDNGYAPAYRNSRRGYKVYI